MPPLLSLVWLALCLYPALIVAVVIHEAGHAFFARMIGYRVTSFGLGTGRLFFRTTLPGGTIFFCCRDNPTLGTCWTTTTELLPPRFHRALLLVGGGATNLLVAVLCYALLSLPPGVVWLALAVMNTLVGLANLFPFRQRVAGSRKTVASDGLQAVSLLLSRHARAEVPQAELGFRNLWDEIGDASTLRYRLFRAALAAQELEASEQTTRYQGEAESLPGDDTDAHLAYLQGRVALQKGDREIASRSFADARRQYERTHAPGSIFLCDLYQLFTKESQDPRENPEFFSAPTLSKRADIATKLAAIRVLLFTRDPAAHSTVETMEALLARYESARRNYRNDIEEANVYTAVAKWRRQNGDAAGARIASEQSAKIMGEIANALSADPVLRDWHRQHTEFSRVP
ncbi:MAG: M50 family metallopeptidase [Fibrella sp.]|nr:M50 family metallopeptidase [Armatimonadota bacterium]